MSVVNVRRYIFPFREYRYDMHDDLYVCDECMYNMGARFHVDGTPMSARFDDDTINWLTDLAWHDDNECEVCGDRHGIDLDEDDDPAELDRIVNRRHG